MATSHVRVTPHMDGEKLRRAAPWLHVRAFAEDLDYRGLSLLHARMRILNHNDLLQRTWAIRAPWSLGTRLKRRRLMDGWMECIIRDPIRVWVACFASVDYRRVYWAPKRV
jgi:hypothetical protein